MPKCIDCKWYDEESAPLLSESGEQYQSGRGRCRVRAPSMDFPVVKSDDWCGEWVADSLPSNITRLRTVDE